MTRDIFIIIDSFSSEQAVLNPSRLKTPKMFLRYELQFNC